MLVIEIPRHVMPNPYDKHINYARSKGWYYICKRLGSISKLQKFLWWYNNCGIVWT